MQISISLNNSTVLVLVNGKKFELTLTRTRNSNSTWLETQWNHARTITSSLSWQLQGRRVLLIHCHYPSTGNLIRSLSWSDTSNENCWCHVHTAGSFVVDLRRHINTDTEAHGR